MVIARRLAASVSQLQFDGILARGPVAVGHPAAELAEAGGTEAGSAARRSRSGTTTVVARAVESSHYPFAARCRKADVVGVGQSTRSNADLRRISFLQS